MASIVKLVNSDFQSIILEKYGAHERNMTKFTPDKNEAVQNQWQQYWSILIKGKNKFYLSMNIDSTGRVVCDGGGDFALKNMDGVLNDLMRMIDILNEDGAVIFAGINTEELHDEKHRVVTKFESGGSSTGAEGWSMWDFFEFLPGINWFTFFGKAYLQFVDRAKFLNLEHVTYLKLEHDAIAFSFNQPIHKITLADQEFVEEQIGETLFFSKSREKQSLSHPAAFKVFLKDLEKEYDAKVEAKMLPL